MTEQLNIDTAPTAKKRIIPVTILTGFLGSGKTTLLKNLLSQPHGYKIAIIENEFGSENIDQELIYQHTNEHIVQMNNGCICCNIRGDLQAALMQLQSDQASGLYDFDYVVIETTGLAEPSPIAQTFFLDEGIAKAYRLDGVICLVDAKHTLMHAKQHTEIQKQIGFADQLCITKLDLVDEAAANALTSYLQQVNLRAPRHELNHGALDCEIFFNLKAFNLDDALTLDASFLDAQAAKKAHHLEVNSTINPAVNSKTIPVIPVASAHNHEHNHGHNEHDHVHDENCTHHSHHQHIPQVQSFAYITQQPFDMKKLETFFGNLMHNYSKDLLRYKGVLWVKGMKEKVIIQGVHEVCATHMGKKWTQIKPQSKLIFIGMDLPKEILQKGLDLCTTY